MMLSEHFDLRELVHPTIYERIGDRCADWLHPMLADTLESFKRNLSTEEETEYITVNNWHLVEDWETDNCFKSSGLRLPDDVGVYLSAHKGGCTADCKFKNNLPVEVADHILAEPDRYPHITRIEDPLITETWLHIEVGQRLGKIRVFKP